MNGYAATNLVRHAAYAEALIRLLRSLTKENPDGRLVAAMTDKEAFDAAIKFRRAHGLLIADCNPLYYVIGLHRCRIRHPAMTVAEVNWSEHWLIREGHGCDVDTEFNPRPAEKSV